ncbi:MarR family transcriptional regulator [Persicimonas caeni]|uniref:MarR family transcriptional regulator n=1 Tax=Persicimonas caeni TaxID=2292766 RepID=A0A4Y6PYU3_PERCE|nr:MarR family transcriptional regulator [Persicimonas caeni]QDG53504.1 MarR family transcriptional regulator [Persicimonas caeni]QED34725.1 MarR family transcriptional regulator [Persicimonas caeni]
MTIPRSLEGALGFNITRVALLFRRELIVALQEYDLTPEQWQILVAIVESEQAVDQTALAQVTLKDKPNVSRILKRMERDGWVERVVNPEDARAKLVRPSEQATEQYPEIRRTLEGHFEELLRPLDAEVSTQMVELTHQLRKVLGDPPRSSEASTFSA